MGAFSDYQPMFVEVETTTRCNRRCKYCPNSIFDRGLERNEIRMPEELFYKIVHDLGQNHYCNQFSPHNYGEPLVDPRMPNLLRIAREEMPLCRIALYTNGDFLDPDTFKRIEPFVDVIVVTQHGAKMSPAIAALFAAVGRDHQKIRYKTRETIVANASNRGGLIPMRYRPRRACGVVMNELHINAHGELILCCEDYLAEKVFGNIRDMTIEEAWTQDERLRTHRANVRGAFTLPKCRTCGYGRFTGS